MSKYNFFNRFLASTIEFHNNMVSWSFNSTGIMLLTESTAPTDIVQYSFNGTDVHGEIRPNTPAAGLSFDNRTESRIYFRLVEGANPTIVRVETWGSR